MPPLALLLLGLLLAGCATAFPEAVMRDVDRSITVAELRRDPDAHLNQRVIVGGEIIATQPRPGETEIELLTRPLRRDDSPQYTDRSEGRVLLKVKEFLDPAVYAKGRRLTVVGAVTGTEERKVGEQPYRYPMITADHLRLWPPEYAEAPAFYPGYPWGYYTWPYYPYSPYFFGRYPYYPYPPYWW